MKKKTSKKTKGFSLIELLIVVAIILIIAAIAIPNLLRARRSANEGSATASMRTLGSGELLYRSTNGHFTDLAGLSADSIIDNVLGGVLDEVEFAELVGRTFEKLAATRELAWTYDEWFQRPLPSGERLNVAMSPQLEEVFQSLGLPE